MKIAVITTATLDLNFRDYIIDNSLEYCGKHGYTFMVYENKIDEGASVIANKTMNDAKISIKLIGITLNLEQR